MCSMELCAKQDESATLFPTSFVRNVCAITPLTTPLMARGIGADAMSEKNYTVYHLHTELSLQDSVTKFQDYIDRAMELGQTALAFTEHGNIYQWVAKKIACDEAGLKYLHGCEIYLTEALLMPPDPSEVRRQVMEEVWQREKEYDELRKAPKKFEAYLETLQRTPDGRAYYDRFCDDLDVLHRSEAGEQQPFDAASYISWRTEELTKAGMHKVRDNFHTILIARNYAGLQEMNELISRSSQEDHFYYKPRITFEEFLGLSRNVIKISACLASPLNKMGMTHPMYERLLRHYDYLEIQAHNCPEQVAYNRHLAEMSQRYHIPLIAGTDTHSLDGYKAECRTIMQLSKHIEFADEDTFDLTYKSYDELVNMFAQQDAIPSKLYLEAIENTNRMADSVEPFELDTSFKYPPLYSDRDREVLHQVLHDNLEAKITEGAITAEQVDPFREAIAEECRVFDKIDMSGFMLFMSEMVTWCKGNGIPIGFNRGSCGGSRVAYVSDTTDLNPETWHTVFSRFCNEDRKEIGDIDIDVSPSQRDLVYDYIINRFGQEKTAFILAIGTIKSKGCIDEICRALSVRWNKEHQHDEKAFRKVLAALKDNGVEVKFGDARDGNGAYLFDEKGNLILSKDLQGASRAELIKEFTKEYSRIKEENERIFAQNPWAGKVSAVIKSEYGAAEQRALSLTEGKSKEEAKKIIERETAEVRKKYSDVFYYYDGLLDVAISQSMHPAGIVASPLTLRDNYGTFISEGKEILQIDMDCVHDVSLVKYDILGLKNIEIIKDAYELMGRTYPKSHEINWDDQEVWKDMLRSPVGIFQFEGDFAFQMLKQYEPHSIFDMSLVTAALRPSGASYRDDLMQHKPHKNPSALIDELLKDNYGYLVYQEDVIKFLQQICGFSGSDADNARRTIARKKPEDLEKILPDVLKGYCEKSPQPQEVAEQEAKEFLQIISDASSYMFGYNHSVGYCMIGYLCAYLRYYHPFEFITAYLNNANGEDDVKAGNELAKLYGIKIVPPRFGLSKDKYLLNKEEKVIAKGITSVKYMNADVANELYELAAEGKPKSFMELLTLCDTKTHLDTRQRDILVRIDYFSEYGNAKELLKMVQLFAFFKNGSMKKILKEKLTPEMQAIVAQYATDVSKNGAPAKSYTFTDMSGFLLHLERMVREMNIQDFDLKSKMNDQLECLGYIDLTTNKKEDLRKLIILDVFPLKSKRDGSVWGYALQVRSIGSGKHNRWTVRSWYFDKKPVKKLDVIEVPKSGWHEERGYLYLDCYDYVI